MAQFFVEGGFGMYPVLIFGLVMLAAAARYAVDPERPRLRLVGALGLVLATTTVHAVFMDVAAVFHHVADPALTPDAELTRTVFVGLMESTRPGALGGAMLSLALVIATVGVARAGQRELRARAAAPVGT